MGAENSLQNWHGHWRPREGVNHERALRLKAGVRMTRYSVVRSTWLVSLEFLYVPVLGGTCEGWGKIHIASGWILGRRPFRMIG